tara:strand:- start:398 stop:1048 length:651 start_codon:yes stop_codon:yes gene_type:complete
MIRQNNWVCFKDGLDKETCEKILNYAENKLPKISDKEEVNDAHHRYSEDPEKTDIAYVGGDGQWICDSIWKYMSQANEEAGWKYSITSTEPFQIARYKKGMYYDWHPDGKSDHLSTYKSIINPLVHGRIRKLTMAVILNDDWEGGEFQFAKFEHPPSETMVKTWEDRPAPDYKIHTPECKTGSVLVFPSDMWHRVKPVTKGIRYTLVAWFLGPPFI